MASSSILSKLLVLISGDASGLDKSLGGATKKLSAFQKASTGAANALTGALAAVSFAAIGREIISITSEFQKFEAVLTNTLGSNSEAQKALEKIRDFASKTPFSVEELTASFVKLANQGFEPTRDEMRKLGDLASSTGKSFDQLTEAIIDAQTGEFERLKEFGIRASKSGDQVKFTFKGVETQTKFTNDAIRDYILSLGDLEGVSGSMEAISQTLGGSISNLGDSFDNLLLTVGNLTSGVLKDFVDLAQNSIKTLADDIAGNTGATSRLDAINEQYVESARTIEDVNKNLETLARLKKTEEQDYQTASAALGDMNNQVSLSTEEYFKLNREQATAKDFANAYAAAIEALTKKQEELNKKLSTQALALIPSINAKIKEFETLKNSAFSETQIGIFNNKIKELREELEFLNATGSESPFLKNLNKQQAAGQTPTIGGPKESTPESPFQTTLDIDIQPYQDKLLEAAQAQDAFGTMQEESFDQQRARWDSIIAKQVEAADSAAAYGTAIGDSLGEALSGQITFAQAVKKITGDLVKMFLQRALAGIVASAATSGGPPPVAIALAAAGMAAISSFFNKIGGAGGGGGGGGSVGGQATRNFERMRPAGNESRIDFDAKFVIEGQTLVAVVDSTNQQNRRLRG